MASNQEQIDHWDGAGGSRWVEHQALLDRALTPFGARAIELAGVRPGERVLDVGCGCGDTTLALAERVGSAGEVEGIDLSSGMLERARKRAAGRENLRFVRADASEHAFATRFDLIYSRFGVMFFAEPIAALAHLRAALRPQGRLAFVCWRSLAENPWAALPLQVVRGVFADAPAPSSEDQPGPYAFAKRDKLEQILLGAGFRDVRIERFDAQVVFAIDDLEEAARFGCAVGPASRLLLDAPAEVHARARDAMIALLAQHRGPAGISLPGSSWVVSGRVAPQRSP